MYAPKCNLSFLVYNVGITSITQDDKVNPYQSSSFTCTVQGDPVPQEDSVELKYASGNILVTDGITRESSSTSDSERQVIFSVDSVSPGVTYYCYLVGTAYLDINANTYG